MKGDSTPAFLGGTNLGSTIHGVRECKGAGTNEAACGVFAASVSFRACSRPGEGARRRHVGHMPPPCHFRGLLARERG